MLGSTVWLTLQGFAISLISAISLLIDAATNCDLTFSGLLCHGLSFSWNSFVLLSWKLVWLKIDCGLDSSNIFLLELFAVELENKLFWLVGGLLPNKPPEYWVGGNKLWLLSGEMLRKRLPEVFYCCWLSANNPLVLRLGDDWLLEGLNITLN